MRLAGTDQRPRQRNGGRKTRFSQLLYRRPARIGKAEELRRLVERLARRIVDRRGEAAVIAKTAHFEQLAVPAGDEQQEIGEIEIGIDQPRRERVAFEMVDGDQRLAGGKREALAGKQRDHHSADQPRAGGRRHGVDVMDRNPGVIENLADQRRQNRHVRPRRNLGNHAAVRLMRLGLADDRLSEDLPVAGDQRRRAVVARGFEAEDQSHFVSGPLPDGAAMH